MLIKLIVLVCLNNTVHMNIENKHIGHKYLEKLIMFGLGIPYWIHHKFMSQKRVLELVILLFKSKS